MKEDGEEIGREEKEFIMQKKDLKKNMQKTHDIEK